MVTRREFIRSAALYAALPGVAITNTACAADGGYGAKVHASRSPLNESAEHGALLQELVRCATLAANGHNTQPWKFGLSPDGLFSRLSGTPASPRWLGNVLFSMVLSEKSENDKCAKQLRSSAGLAVFVGERADPANWLEVGRAYEHFALAATALGVRTAFVNQPVEVPAVRTQFAQWLGLGSRRPDLVVRFGRGPQLPYSLRRPVADVIV